jgi:hypothetical protein
LRQGTLKLTKEVPLVSEVRLLTLFSVIEAEKPVRASQPAVSLPDNSELNRKVFEDEKKQGNNAFRSKQYGLALQHYSKCIDACPQAGC